MEQATRACVGPAEAVDLALISLRGDRVLRAQSVDKFEVVLRQFARFLETGCGRSRLREATARDVRAFVDARTVDGREPSLALRHLRRAAVRVLFRASRRLGVADGDPTLDVGLPPRAAGPFRPLEDEEVVLARAATAGPATSSSAVAWALAEATARTGELPWLERHDVDLERQRVWLHGSSRTEPRWGQLTDWAVLQMRGMLSGRDSDGPLLGLDDPGSALAQSSAVQAIARTLRRAGLAGEPGVRPSSVAAWAGRRIYHASGRIEDSARALGIRSLDRAARFIAWDWASLD